MIGKLLGLWVVAGLFLSCSNQEISSGKVPSVVLNAVSQQHPAKEEVEWKKLGNLYEAEMDLNDSTDLTMQVAATGKVIMQKQDIPLAGLPEAVRAAIQTQYPGYTVDDAERVDKDGAVYYQVELEASGNKDRELVFTAEGREDPNTRFWD